MNSLVELLSRFWRPFLVILASFTFTYLIKTQKHHFHDKLKKHKLPPGPKPWPIVGNLPEMLANRPTHKWIHNLMNDMSTEIACIVLGSVHVIVVTSAEIALEFFRKQDAIFASRPITMSADLASRGYLTTILVPYGEQWKKMKKIISKELLSPLRHQWLHDKRIEEADNLISYVYSQCINPCKGGLVNVRIAARHYCANVARKILFSKRYFGKNMKDGGPGFEEIEHVDAIFTVVQFVHAFCVSDFMPCLRGLDLDGQEKIVKQAVKILKRYHDPIIAERIEQWKNGIKISEEDLLDVLITLKDNDGNSLLTTEEIKAQLTELMFAAVDNPSNAIEWALAEMLNEPELIQRATEEIDKVVGKERLVQESDLPRLNYVKACIREAFRLHPVMPFNFPHVSMKDTVVNNYFIPKGSQVLLSRTAIGRNPKVWDEPHKFKPERHLKSDGSEVVLTEPNLDFISFGTGRRGCPGIVLGTSMSVMLFARLLHGFSWSMPPNESSIDLSECESTIFLAKPLVALAKPRLSLDLYAHLYPKD
ncbi:hypothetical protein L6164_000073 [Bauhinia variegata]|uniref:Uncharacterized protein n=1 Tax=Bauhinia variegata TaxID=167791 RepID=A0ACB9Q6W2_BAUVA|nr:hypothetical protein L6164_000073 [Bauhinia variegata]